MTQKAIVLISLRDRTPPILHIYVFENLRVVAQDTEIGISTCASGIPSAPDRPYFPVGPETYRMGSSTVVTYCCCPLSLTFFSHLYSILCDDLS